EAEDLLLIDLEELFRRREVEHERDVRDLETLLCQERRQRCFRRATHADEDEVGFGEVTWLLAVVVAYRELYGFDAPKVLVGDRVQQARNAARLLAEKASELGHERADEIDRVNVFLVAERA